MIEYLSPLFYLFLIIIIGIAILVLSIIIDNVIFIISALIFTKNEKVLLVIGNDEYKNGIFNYNFNLGRFNIKIYPSDILSGNTSYSNNVVYKEYSVNSDLYIKICSLFLYSIIFFYSFYFVYYNSDYLRSINTHLPIIYITLFIFLVQSILNISKEISAIFKYKRLGYSEYVSLKKLSNIHNYYEDNGAIYKKLIDYNEELKKYNDKLTINSLNNIYKIIIYYFENINKHEEAKKIYYSYLSVIEKKLNPEKHIANIIFIKDISLLMQDYKNAIKYSDLAIDCINKHKDSKNNLTRLMNSLLITKAYSLVFLEKYEESIKISEILLNNDTNKIECLDMLGLAKIKQGYLEEGYKYVNKALENTENSGIYYSLGVYHYEKKEFEEALKNFKKSKELNKYFYESDKYIKELESI